MKRQTIIYLIFASTVFLSCRDEINNIKADDSVVKMFFLDTNYIDVSCYKNFDSYTDIQLKGFNQDKFTFQTPTKTFEIYYDSTFLHIAGKIVFTQHDSMVDYKMFDYFGNLRLTYEYINISQPYKKRKSWHPNGNLRSVETFNGRGDWVSDSSFFENNTPNEVSLFVNGTIYKALNFYRNGNLENETYYARFTPPDTFLTDRVFVVNYDSLTQKPTMYYSNDKTYQDKNNPGTFFSEQSLLPVPEKTISGTK